MLKDNLLDILQKHQKDLQEFGVKSLAIFGSVVRDEAWADSDVDILVEFSRPVGLLAFLKLKRHLEKILGKPVDLVTSKALRPQWRERIIREAIHAVQ
jgi:predicted nucleotidyltransferase